MKDIKIDYYQAMWAMNNIPTSTNEWSLEEKIRHISKDGYAGILHFIDKNVVDDLAIYDLLEQHHLKLGLSCLGYDLQDIEDKISYAKSKKAEFLNIMVKSYHTIGIDAIEKINSIIKLGDKYKIKVLVETHRRTLTQDLIRTMEYIRCIDDLRFTLDLSHFVVSGELLVEEEDLISADIIKEIIKRSDAIHVRISNGEQVQIHFEHLTESLKLTYFNWWKDAISNWSQSVEAGESFPFILELGPAPYDMIHDQVSLNRYEESLQIRDAFDAFIKND